MPDTSITIRVATDADLGDEAFRQSWMALADRCTWATCFQRPKFVATWYEVYRPTHTPYLVCGWRDERLIGLLPLAFSVETGKPAVAGTYQAEYQSWLADPSDDETFIKLAMSVFDERFPGAELLFRYLPNGAPADHLLEAGYGARLTKVSHQRPLMRINGDAIAKSLSKKSNKSRFNRLKRLGNVALERLTSYEEFESVIDDVIWQYDLRQGAINHSTPFLEDPFKRPFHLALMSQPDALHVTVLRVDDTVVSSHVDYLDPQWSYLGVPSHSPFYFQHSPGKLHMLLLGKLLADEAIECLDLTPGGDPWKERFANDHDEVFEVTVHGSAFARSRSRLPVVVRTGLRKAITGMGVDPKKLKSMLARVPGLGARLGNGVRLGKVHGSESLFCLSAINPVELSVSETVALRTRANKPSDLLYWMDGETLATKHALLSVALARLERNQRLITCVDDDVLLGYAWIVNDPAKAGLDNPLLSGVSEAGVLIHDVVVQAQKRAGQVRETLVKAMLVDMCEHSSDDARFALVDESIVAALRTLDVKLTEPDRMPVLASTDA